MEGGIGMTLEAMQDGEARVGMGSGLFPVIHSIFAADALQAAVAQAYLSDRRALTCRLLRRGLHDTYLLTTDDDCYIARVYRARRRASSDIAYELELLTQLPHSNPCFGFMKAHKCLVFKEEFWKASIVTNTISFSLDF